MHSQYLSPATSTTKFARGEFEVDGQRLNPAKIDIDTYVLAAVDDHIVPWVSGYKTTQLFGGTSRFCTQHVGAHRRNRQPTWPKAKHWTNDAHPADPQEWKDNATLQTGTWWEDWTKWIAKQGGPKVAAPAKLGNKDYPVIEKRARELRARSRMSSGLSTFIDSRVPCVSGIKIAMQVQGKGDPLLVINGLTRPLQSWDPFTAALQGRTVVSFDVPGVGGSPTSMRPLSIAELAILAEEVLDAAGLADADVLGYSLGGAVAQQLAHDAPHRVRGLISSPPLAA